MGTALARSESETNLAVKAASYEMPAWKVDGMDVLAVEATAKRAVADVRGGGGPLFLQLDTYRFRAHSMFDPELYRRRNEVEEWKHRDPIDLFGNRLREANVLSDRDLQLIEEDVRAEVDAAVEFAEAGTWEAIEDLTRFVYSEEPVS
jgi:pyruvate dehydrogenase E1 component alpha subunit